MRRVVLVVMALALSVAAVAAQQTPPPQPAQDGFVPVESLPSQEQLPAAPFVMTAYAVAWIAAFAYLWSIGQRLGRVERDIAAISRRVEAGSRR